MVQVTPNPREGDPKMSEEKRAKEAPGGPKTPKPEVHNVRFEWSALPAGQASDILAYKNQRRQGDVPQGVQTVPAVWVPSPQSTPWQYSGVTEEGLLNQSPTVLEFFGVKEVIVCSGLIMLLLVLLRYLEQSRFLSRLRPRRWQEQNTKVEVICQVQEELPSTRLPSKPNDPSNKQDMPPSYSKIDLTGDGASKDGKQKELFPPYCCIFTTGKNKVPHVLIYDPRNEKEVLDNMRLSSYKGQPFRTRHMKFNAPTKPDVKDPKKEMANFVIEINDAENESGCVIGMDVLVDKNHEDAKILDEHNGIPFSIKLEQLKSKDPKQIKKSKKDGKK